MENSKYTYKQSNKGFTLIELLVSVAIIGIISAVAVPSYIGYVQQSRATVAQNNLRAIYLQQKEYYTDNNVYYSTGTSCSDSASIINTNLFAGEQVLTNTYYTYCILQSSTTTFTAHARLITDTSVDYTITETNAVNW